MSPIEVDGSPFHAEPVLRPRQQVEQQIKQAIISGTFGPGERLPSETKLASEFSVSRATIREALRSLAENGLIIKMPGAKGGSFVQYVDHHALANVLGDRLKSTLELGNISYEEVAQVRSYLDIPSSRLAAANRTNEQIMALREIVDDEKDADVTDAEVPDLNIRFHSNLAEATGNRLLAAIIATLYRVARPLAFIDADVEVGRDAVRQHIEIVTAVEEQDVDGAAEAMRRHLEYLRLHASS
ncbi:MAG: FadR/GntR family transcriptional regulator [Solirubrobacterales bacterium]